MKDRESTYPGRLRLDYVETGEGYVVADVSRADEPTVEGTALNKRTLLPDYIAEALGLDPETATPADAIKAIAEGTAPLVQSVTVADSDTRTVITLVYDEGGEKIVLTWENGYLNNIALSDRDIPVTWGGSSGSDS